MHKEDKSILIVSMPFAETSIPSIQLSLLESYLKQQNINAKTSHLYLLAADFYGLNNYNFLINSPNDSYTAQMIYSKYLFPNHWEKNIDKFREYYNNVILKNKTENVTLSFELYIKQTDRFYKWVIENINWKDFDIIGFTLNYGQFLPSLAISKKIKEIYPEKIIVFGGSTTIDKLGVRVLKAFDFVDFIVSGDGEKPLFLLTSDYDNYVSIPGLIYKNGKDVFFNPAEDNFDINDLPFLDFSSYFNDLKLSSNEIMQYFSLNGRLPIELSRGCWWNKCTFCNIDQYHKKYREKDVDRFVGELCYLSENYKMLDFQVIGTTLPKSSYKILCEKIINLGKNFSLYAEARAKILKKDDYVLLKQAGFLNIQTGIETFSQNYLKKINKGVRLIDNVAALKFCKENNINNSYNLIVNYPNEEEIDFDQTKNTISIFKSFLEPPQISKFVVGFGSPIYNNPDKFNIKDFEYKTIDKIMYPKDFLERNFCFFSSFNRKNKIKENNWNDLVDFWKKERELNDLNFVKSKKLIDKLIFYFVDGGNFIKIYDKRSGIDVKIFVLNEIERSVFIKCLNITSFNDLIDQLPNISEYQLSAILNSFEKSGIMFREEDFYFCLPLNYSTCLGIDKNKDTDKKIIQREIEI